MDNYNLTSAKYKPSASGGPIAKRSISRESALSSLSSKIKATSD